MKSIIMRVVWILFFGAIANASFAGGRYEDPPANLVEVVNLNQEALEAAKQGTKDAALESAKQGRKLAVESYKDKSTMPMRVSSSSLKGAIASLEAGNLPEAIPQGEHAMGRLGTEVDYYKKEGKIK
jgi:hypothetical protein